jgi:SAM-dependent methyltransferase
MTNLTMNSTAETIEIANRYERRKILGRDDQNDLAIPARYLAHQAKERAFLSLLARWSKRQRSNMRLLEIGCGCGDNLQQFIRWGFDPHNLIGNELLGERCDLARHLLPIGVEIHVGDACELMLPEGSFDIVLQSTVFTSILDDDFQRRLADRMWSLTAPGGGVLWYDFAYDNPKNPDVRGVNLHRIRKLFPSAKLTWQRITLAPPLARMVTRIHPVLYSVFDSLPYLRTHLFCWLEKPDSTSKAST